MEHDESSSTRVLHELHLAVAHKNQSGDHDIHGVVLTVPLLCAAQTRNHVDVQLFRE